MASYESKEQDGVHIITCPPRILPDAELHDCIQAWLLLANTIHVLDFVHVFEFRKTAFRSMSMFGRTLINSGKKLYIMNANPTISQQLKEEGLSSMLVPLKSLDEIRMPTATSGAAPRKKPGLDVEFINPFLEGTHVTLSKQANTETTPGKPYLLKPGEALEIDLAGVLSLKDPAFSGSIALCFKAVVFLKICENMLGAKYAALTPELEGAAGELLNIIFGQAKTILNERKGYKLQKALPSVLTGEKLQSRQNAKPVFVLPFESAAGPFHIEVRID